MGLMDSIEDAAAKAKAAAGGAAAGSDEEHAVGSLLGTNGTQFSGLLDKLRTGGLDDAVKSWIGKGANLPVSGEKIKAVLGSDQIASVAGKLGVSTSAASDKIAAVLPTIVDKLTPDGMVPDPEALTKKLTGFLKR